MISWVELIHSSEGFNIIINALKDSHCPLHYLTSALHQIVSLAPAHVIHQALDSGLTSDSQLTGVGRENCAAGSCKDLQQRM